MDVATARREYYESPATLPVVELSSVKLDLYRRDFSINTLAVKLNKRHFGVLIDFFGGQKDIKDRAIRVLHNLSFVEDPTRVFRAIRFETRFGFKIGKLTENLIRNAVKINVFEKLAGRRLLGELRLLLEEEHPILSIKRMDELKLLELVHPLIADTVQLEDLLSAINGVISWFELLFLDEQCRKWMVYFLGLTENLSVAQLDTFCRRLEMPKKERLELVNSKLSVMETLKQCNVRKDISRAQFYDLFNQLASETLLYMMAKSKNEVVKKGVSLYFTQLRSVKIVLKGRDLKRLGFIEGPIYRTILDDLFHAKLNGEVQTKKDELEYVRSHYPNPAIYTPQPPKVQKRAFS